MPDPPIQLGIDDGADKADAWQGFREATPHSGRLSSVEQSNLSTNPGVPSPGGGGKPLPAPAPARAVETGPDERPSGVEDDVPVVPKGEVARIASPAPEVPEPAKPQPLPPAPTREAQSSDPEQTAREQERDSAEQPPRPEDAAQFQEPPTPREAELLPEPKPAETAAPQPEPAPEPVPEVEPEPRPEVKIETPAEKAEDIAPQSPGQALKTTPAASMIEIPEAPENSEELQRVSSPPSPQEFPAPAPPAPLPQPTPAQLEAAREAARAASEESLAAAAALARISQRVRENMVRTFTGPNPGVPAPPGDPGIESEAESIATALREAVDVKPGRVLATKGLQINTVHARWSTTTLLLARPKNVVVAVTFNREGKVIDADFIPGQSSGYPEVDAPLLNAVYRWTAKGKELEALPAGRKPDGTEHGLRLTFRIILSDE